MRHARHATVLGLAATLALGGCVVPPAPGVPMPARSGVLQADARALRFGASGPEVFANPEMRPKLQALFGADWSRGRLAFGGPEYFPASSSLRLVRVVDQDFIAINGCAPSGCVTHRGLLLIRQDGQHLLARLDEGGYSQYYEHAVGANVAAVPRPVIDGAWDAVADMQQWPAIPR
jgi:hypothetical protein